MLYISVNHSLKSFSEPFTENSFYGASRGQRHSTNHCAH